MTATPKPRNCDDAKAIARELRPLVFRQETTACRECPGIGFLVNDIGQLKDGHCGQSLFVAVTGEVRLLPCREEVDGLFAIEDGVLVGPAYWTIRPSSP